jgi:riboflavin synthase
MFTGIVQSIGRIARADERGDGVRLIVDAGAFATSDIAIGDSIAVSGCCLTVVAIDAGTMAFDVSAETLRCTTGLVQGAQVNLEKALRLSDRLGGHLLSGHVDGVGYVTHFDSVRADGGTLLEVEMPSDIARFVAAKGSIAVDGVSLTTNVVSGRRFTVNLIPHTLAVTTLRSLAIDDGVNLEVDLLARYVARLHEAGERADRK